MSCKSTRRNIDVCPSDPLAAITRHTCVSLGGVSRVDWSELS